MGIKGFYGHCNREIPESHKTVNIIEEIEKYKSETHNNPILIINLWTLSYQFKIKATDLLCGYQLNKIKHIFEEFLGKLKEAGCELVFVIKKTSSDDHEFLRRRLRDYEESCKLLKNIQRLQLFDKLNHIYERNQRDKIPYNVLILVAMIQSAEKFGKIRGANSIYCKPSAAQAEFATEINATWILGLDTYFFFMPGQWKIWSDEKLNMEKMTVEAYDKEAIRTHFDMDYEQMQLMAALSGDLESPYRVRTKISDFFGTKNRFPNLQKFVKDLGTPITDEVLQTVAFKIMGKNYNPKIIDDFKKSLASYKSNPGTVTKVDSDILEIIRDDFMSFAEEILLNENPIFISPVFLNLETKDMINFNSLVLPWIQKTAGILLKNVEDKSPRKIVLLQKNDGKYQFNETPLEVIYPEFEVPDLKVLLGGEMATIDKEKMLYWILGFTLSDMEWPTLPSNYLVDCLILIYLIKNNSLTTMEARIILKTLVDSRNNNELNENYSLDYPTKINSRALRCTFLYQKSYFILHSCLACIGMKNLCPEITFDGVYFQKMYLLNVLNEDEEEEIFYDAETGDDIKEVEGKPEPEIIPDDSERPQIKIVELFEDIVRWATK